MITATIALAFCFAIGACRTFAAGVRGVACAVSAFIAEGDGA